MDLDSLRTKIDTVDREIVKLLNARVNLASEIGKIKEANSEPIYVPSREEEVFAKLAAVNEGPLDARALRAIYREIISAAISLEKRLAIAYLGPEATYTQQAAQKNFGTSVDYQSFGTIADVFDAVGTGRADYGVIPIENSTEGAVFHSLDLLVETDLKIVAQIYLPIAHCLISRSPLGEVTGVHSKDNALGQCRRWLARELPGVELVEADSTAAAVRHAGENPGAAAIASRIASEIYGVPVVAENIQDSSDNITRFLVIGPPGSSCRRLGDGRDKSSYVFSIRDEPGALLRLLAPFSARGVNLVKIESRPSRKKIWDYYFFIDVIGHHDDPPVQGALTELEASCPMVKWLGSYPDT